MGRGCVCLWPARPGHSIVVGPVPSESSASLASLLALSRTQSPSPPREGSVGFPVACSESMVASVPDPSLFASS